ncbi:hypothetical protein COOONC_28036 [Cooperia oncophora]
MIPMWLGSIFDPDLCPEMEQEGFSLGAFTVIKTMLRKIRSGTIHDSSQSTVFILISPAQVPVALQVLTVVYNDAACIAWLAHAAQCSVSELVPRGEVFPHADRYIHERLKQEDLSTVPQDDRVDLAIFQICRVLELLSVFDLRSQSAVDRSILIYAICRLALDKSSCCTMQHRASIAIENVCFCGSIVFVPRMQYWKAYLLELSPFALSMSQCHLTSLCRPVMVC